MSAGEVPATVSATTLVAWLRERHPVDSDAQEGLESASCTRGTGLASPPVPEREILAAGQDQVYKGIESVVISAPPGVAED